VNCVKIIALADGPLATLADACELPPGRIGEIIVTGPTVTREYDQLPEATSRAKIQSPNAYFQGATDTQNSLGTSNLEPGTSAPPRGIVWHRMGDCGYLDPNGRLWFCGRLAERLETENGPMFTEPCEQVFRLHPQVARCALVGLGPRGRQQPAIVVEPTSRTLLQSGTEQQALADALRQLARGHPHTASIHHFYFRSRFPVDVRHNAKIHRLALTRWAATATAVEVTSDKRQQAD
jgi:acyl-CoA synthetase (AMP-forming)/AMP-acid ligase II